jgi:hypothetical protein
MKRTARAGAVAAVLLAAGAAAAGEGRRVPGTPVVMEPPEGFVAETSFAGFGKPDQKASIMVTPLPVPLAQLRAGFTKEGLAGKGVTLVAEETVTLAGGTATLYSVTQSALGTRFRKWILPLDNGGTAAVLIVATFPVESEAALAAPLRQALLSSRLEADGGDPMAGLPFRVQPSGRLKLVSRLGSNLLLSESGQPSADPRQALMVLGPSFSDVDLDDLEAFSKARAARVEQLRDLRLLSGRPITVDGLAGWELVADAADVKSGIALRVYQLVLRDGKRYFMAQGLVEAARGDEFVEEFRKVAGSFGR